MKRENALLQMAGSANGNFTNRGKANTQHHSIILIVGGSGIGKTRAGYEVSRLSDDLLKEVSYSNHSFIQSMQGAVYVYLKFTNGISYNDHIDVNVRESVRIGARLAVSLRMFNIGNTPLTSLTQIVQCVDYFDLDNIVTQLKQVIRSSRPVSSDHPLALLIHMDEIQYYTQKTGSSDIQTLLNQIGSLMQRSTDIFILPICTGTSDRGRNRMKTGYHNVSIDLHPLDRLSCTGIIEHHFRTAGVSPTDFIGTCSFEVGLGDTGYIPKDISYFLQFCITTPYQFGTNCFKMIDSLNRGNTPVDPRDLKQIYADAFIESPLRMDSTLPSGATVDDLRLNGILYLLPSPKKRDYYRLYLSFYNLKSFNLSSECPWFPDDVLKIPSRHGQWRWQQFETLYPFFQQCLIQSYSGDLTVHKLFRGAYGLDIIGEMPIEVAPQKVCYEVELGMQLRPIKTKDNPDSKVVMERDLLDCQYVFICDQNAPNIDQRFAVRLADGRYMVVYTQTKHSKQDVKNPKYSSNDILENSNLACAGMNSMASSKGWSSEQWIGVFVIVTNRQVDEEVIQQFVNQRAKPGNPTKHIRDNHHLLVISRGNFVSFFGETFAHRGLLVGENHQPPSPSSTSTPDDMEADNFYYSQN
ncbi:hypothetical protein SAMD00019534_074920 [Acytostelium subglobosum LB1]|uniref:hypothetical protein n=1 Tax=Acytostelium subglobosum LB1 TaxID=1410327 RepID=UPI000644AF28|nr:hypothetical protein SAMD00019534_074920 [Acytostelium subglobosum LB1]GAM24317.1 hypothetical protein SAMD00019534_074920 [Acytostelium subglobosum LB1]|eukprot:XP_012752643.1 hypothetical protein SAMD00019534_074920 [Acytostelium subglobosum LB1]